MKLKYFSAFFLIIILAACSEQPTTSLEQKIIEDAATALGGRIAIDSATTFSIEAEGTLGNLGQDVTAETAEQFFKISDYKQSNNLSSKQMHIKLISTPDYLYFRGPDPINISVGIDGNIAYNIEANGNARRGSDDQATELNHLYYHHPLKLIHEALKTSATLSNGRTENGINKVNITTTDGLNFTLATDATSNLVSSITSIQNHPVLRDVAKQTIFSDYTQIGDLNLPSHLINSIDDFELYNLKYTKQSINGENTDLSVPASAMAALPASTPAEITAEKIADGIWLLAGGYNSLVVEYSDHLTLYESPSESRGLAVIAKARTLVPNKPLTHVVNTHHHFDHSGGIRAAISEGLTIITQSANEAFYKSLAARSSKIVPDALEKKPMDIKIITIDDKMVHVDDAMTVEFYHITDNPHAKSLLMAYFPAQKILYQADVYSSGATYHPFAAKFLEMLKGLDLDIERIIPVHGSIATYDDLVKAVGE